MWKNCGYGEEDGDVEELVMPENDVALFQEILSDSTSAIPAQCAQWLNGQWNIAYLKK